MLGTLSKMKHVCGLGGVAVISHILIIPSQLWRSYYCEGLEGEYIMHIIWDKM